MANLDRAERILLIQASFDIGGAEGIRDKDIQFLLDELEMAEAKLVRIRELHHSYHIYDECEHEHKAGEPGVIDIDEIGLTCEKLYDICYACCYLEHMGQTEECADSHDHGPDKPICKTRAILDDKGAAS